MEQRIVEVQVRQVSPFLDSPSELERPTNARALRARAVAETVLAAGPVVDLPLRALWARLARWSRQRQTYYALMRCSDRVLADIGIDGEDIPLVARGIDPHEHHGRTRRRWWSRLGNRIDAAGRAWRERRRIYRELMAYRDEELDDLGIRRSDIPAIARGRLPAPA